MKFWDSLHISGTVEARNFKFGRQIGHWDTNEKNAKLGQHGREQGQVTYFFLNFGTPQRRWVKRLQNSKHCAANVQSYATAVVRKQLGLFARL